MGSRTLILHHRYSAVQVRYHAGIDVEAIMELGIPTEITRFFTCLRQMNGSLKKLQIVERDSSGMFPSSDSLTSSKSMENIQKLLEMSTLGKQPKPKTKLRYKTRDEKVKVKSSINMVGVDAEARKMKPRKSGSPTKPKIVEHVDEDFVKYDADAQVTPYISESNLNGIEAVPSLPNNYILSPTAPTSLPALSNPGPRKRRAASRRKSSMNSSNSNSQPGQPSPLTETRVGPSPVTDLRVLSEEPEEIKDDKDTPMNIPAPPNVPSPKVPDDKELGPHLEPPSTPAPSIPIVNGAEFSIPNEAAMKPPRIKRSSSKRTTIQESALKEARNSKKQAKDEELDQLEKDLQIVDLSNLDTEEGKEKHKKSSRKSKKSEVSETALELTSKSAVNSILKAEDAIFEQESPSITAEIKLEAAISPQSQNLKQFPTNQTQGPVVKTADEMKKQSITIHIEKTDALHASQALRQPVVVIHFVDVRSGEYLKKSHPKRKVYHYSELDTLDFIPPTNTRVLN